MQLDNYYIFFMAKLEWIAMVMIIIVPPMIVSMLGCSLITIHTQRGPNMVSSKKNRLTSAAVIYLGANVTSTKGIATHIMHITGIMIKSLPSNFILSINNKAINATINFPNIADGTKLIFFADLMMFAPIANPIAVTKPKKLTDEMKDYLYDYLLDFMFKQRQKEQQENEGRIPPFNYFDMEV